MEIPVIKTETIGMHVPTTNLRIAVDIAKRKGMVLNEAELYKQYGMKYLEANTDIVVKYGYDQDYWFTSNPRDWGSVGTLVSFPKSGLKNPLCKTDEYCDCTADEYIKDSYDTDLDLCSICKFKDTDKCNYDECEDGIDHEKYLEMALEEALKECYIFSIDLDVTERRGNYCRFGFEVTQGDEIHEETEALYIVYKKDLAKHIDITRPEKEQLERIIGWVKGDCEELDLYLKGECYFYSIENKKTKEHFEACFGYLTDNMEKLLRSEFPTLKDRIEYTYD